MNGPHALHDLIMRFVQAAHRDGTFTESVAIEIERQWRLDYDCTTIYVSQMPDFERTKRRQDVVSQYIEGHDIKEITKRHGISRATLYRYLKK